MKKTLADLDLLRRERDGIARRIETTDYTGQEDYLALDRRHLRNLTDRINYLAERTPR